jgi:hypothetical protein
LEGSGGGGLPVGVGAKVNEAFSRLSATVRASLPSAKPKSWMLTEGFVSESGPIAMFVAVEFAVAAWAASSFNTTVCVALPTAFPPVPAKNVFGAKVTINSPGPNASVVPLSTNWYRYVFL